MYISEIAMIKYLYRLIVPSIITLFCGIIFSGCEKTNHLPTLQVIVENSSPLPGSKQTITAVVTDQDTADILLITWDISDGNPYAATGSSIEYTAPSYITTDTIRVEANDQNGGVISETILMDVSNGEPVIASFLVSQPAVLLGNSVELSVTASDPESLPLIYQFSSSGNVGYFSNHDPDDSIAVWIAPSDPELAGNYEIYVTVSDSLDQSTSDTVSVIVYSEHGTMWVVDSGLKTVKKYDESGQFILKADEVFVNPVAIINNHPDNFECWVADNGVGKIFEIDEDGSTIQTFDNIWNISDLQYHKNSGTVCVLSQANKSLKLINGSDVKVIYGFHSPNSIAVNQISDEVLISDYGHQQIIKIDLLPDNGAYPDSISSEHYLAQSNGLLSGPVSITISDYSSFYQGVMVLVADKNGDQIVRIPYDNSYQTPLTSIIATQPINITTTMNYSWFIEEEGTIRFFDTFDPSSESDILQITELTNSIPRVIAGDRLINAVWIADNTTNKIVKVIYDLDQGGAIFDAIITGVNFVEDIVVNR